MNVNEIKEYLKENESNQEVKDLLDSISDRRVSQARKKILEKDFPIMVQEEVDKRLQLEKERQEQVSKQSNFEESLRERLSTYDISTTLGMKFLDDLDMNASKEDIDSRFEELDNWITETKEQAVKESYSGNTPPKRGDDTPAFDIKTASTKEIFANLELINNMR